jgi:hypothetical protein
LRDDFGLAESAGLWVEAHKPLLPCNICDERRDLFGPTPRDAEVEERAIRIVREWAIRPGGVVDLVVRKVNDIWVFLSDGGDEPLQAFGGLLGDAPLDVGRIESLELCKPLLVYSRRSF